MFTLAFAQTPPSAVQPNSSGNFMVILPMYVMIFFVFYLFLIRPQQKKQKEHQGLISQLKKNDEVITAGGIHGTVVNVKEDTVVLKVDDNVKIEFQKSTISTVKKSRKAE